MLARVTKLSDKALLVKLTQRRPTLTRRDDSLSARLRSQEGDRSLAVFKRLFLDKASPINQILQANAEVYKYHKEHTHPHVDCGPRLLPTDLYFEYTQEMHHRIAKVDRLMDAHMPFYNSYVMDDVNLRNAGAAAGRACSTEYPSAEEFRASCSNVLRFSALPDRRHILFDLTEEDEREIERAEQEASQLVAGNTVQQMLEPIERLVERLSEYTGEKGQRFHASLVDNVIEGCKRARRIAIQPSQELLAHIEALERTAEQLRGDVETLKGSANLRAQAKATLEQAASKFNDYF